MLPSRVQAQNTAYRTIVRVLGVTRETARTHVRDNLGVARDLYHELYALAKGVEYIPPASPEANEKEYKRTAAWTSQVLANAKFRSQITGDQEHPVQACHLYAHRHQIPGINDAANGMVMTCNEHFMFDSGELTIDWRDGRLGGSYAHTLRVHGNVVRGFDAAMQVWLKHNNHYWTTKGDRAVDATPEWAA